ncbi:hypothetical protein [Pseudomonas aeruginosa]|uniref:hypothetical protein n=1 Tax=Pseudomonas aeruginosa TaxID=287 RepID=UPI003D2976A7
MEIASHGGLNLQLPNRDHEWGRLAFTEVVGECQHGFSEEVLQMVRHSPQSLPLLNDGESPKLIALTTTHGLHVLKVTHYDSFDAESTPCWCTACSEAWTVEPADVVWWAYADEVRDLIESLPTESA